MAVPESTTGRRVTALDVAREAGVSRATVGFVLNNTPGQTIPANTRERVLRAAEHLGYRPNSAARALASGRSRIILLVLPDWPVEYRLRDYLDEAALALDKAGYSLVTYTSHPAQAARPLWEALSPDLVVSPVPFSPPDVASMLACGVREIYPEPNRPDLPDVSLATSAGPELQVDHLHERGHRNLVFAAFPEPRMASLAAARHQAAHDRARSLGLSALDLQHIDYHDGSADRVVRRWLDAGITGVIAVNDDVAAAVASAAVRAGLRMPADLAVVGHDDAPIATMFVPALSTVRIDTAALGRGFAEFALHRIDRRPLPASRTRPKPTLVRRETS
ncbi:LacI family DNA-binding transcriptional regulator [Frankia sp. CNm7]|uniref:LacI family DNA-binding transcriptional regulator n=1 Tax=Frankia nepalensis TaxID=1836974 RepID=A0A937R9N5_9ACTN|nr:LacI family DNA-binding transcriptional regulator [Frankia nepalensis]MBL7498227.1 LacI family DNA-binding transcriptional regulator [Frankia nepalensis]MBL7509523.1 LacI family DNA-binding transcriptional regulator [Frankia nepalensis]MBL7517762.1 LacI family DNA-binding transcriptional regulator [Frankia nepalensis]MBL7626287.1 LacI family DNA-binding transcriptional regulator [Frankia nepalensis]